MKQIEIAKAYQKLESLAGVSALSKEEQWSLYQLRKQLKPHFEFQVEREHALVDKYREFADENGTLNGEKADEYNKELRDLGEMDIEIEAFKKPKIRFVDGIDFMTAEKLEDFVDFVQE